MTITVATPDGGTAAFPDGTPKEAIAQAMRAKFGEPTSGSRAGAALGGGLPQGSAPQLATPGEVAVDMARVVPGGLAKGAVGVGTIQRDVADLAQTGAQRGMELLTGQQMDPYTKTALDVGSGLLFGPGSGDVNTAIDEHIGYYHPRTTGGERAETVASFAPAAIAPGGAWARIARVAIPGATSETAGELTEGTPYEPWARAFGALAGGGLTALGRPAAAVANRAASALGVERNPTATATRMLRDTVEAGPGGAAGANARLAAHEAGGASGPSLIDVGGNQTRRLVRAAASGAEGEAQDTAQGHVDRLTADLQDRATGHAMRLTPGETRTAPQVERALKETQDLQAQRDYPVPYSKPVPWTPELERALSGQEGETAIRTALRGASSRSGVRDIQMAKQAAQQAKELRDYLDYIKNPRDAAGRVRPVPRFSGGALDRVRIAMRDLEESASNGQRPRMDVASGFKGRQQGIDTALDQVPDLKEARAAYSGMAAQRKAVEHGASGTSMPNSQYAPELERLSSISPDARAAAGIGHRQAIVDAIQHPAAGSTGVLNRFATGTEQARNLTSSFGPRAAQYFQGAIQNEVRRLQNARFVSPNTGSQTALREAEHGLLTMVTPRLGHIAAALDWLKRTGTLTAAQRAEIVRLGTSEAELRNILAQIPPRMNTVQAVANLVVNSRGQNDRQRLELAQ